MKRIIALTALLFAAMTVSAQSVSITATSGFVQSVDSNITVVDIVLDQGGTASLTCPVTFYGAGTYARTWKCGAGTLSVDGVVVAQLSPNPDTATMTYTCSGGGRGGRPKTCSYRFYSDTADGGSVSWSSRFSSITAFSATYSPAPATKAYVDGHNDVTNGPLPQSPIAPTPICLPNEPKWCPATDRWQFPAEVESHLLGQSW